MKKSTLSITIGIAGIFILISIANLKLSAEYKKGNIRSGMAAIQLPVYHHIKEIRSTEPDRFGGYITLIQHKDSSALLYNYYGSPDILYSVKNDTLFLEPELIEDKRLFNLTIYFQDLKSIQSSNSNITINKCRIDSLSVKAANYSSLYFTDATLNKLKLEATDEAGVTLSSKDTIPFASIHLRDRAMFKANIAAFLEKEIKMDANSTISFSGMCADNFGIKRTLVQK